MINETCEILTSSLIVTKLVNHAHGPRLSAVLSVLCNMQKLKETTRLGRDHIRICTLDLATMISRSRINTSLSGYYLCVKRMSAKMQSILHNTAACSVDLLAERSACLSDLLDSYYKSNVKRMSN